MICLEGVMDASWGLSIYIRIKHLATQKNISGKELGELLGLKKSPLTDWKNQKSYPTIEQLAKLCEIFAVSSDYLLFGNLSAADNHEMLQVDELLLLSYYRKLSVLSKEDLVVIARALSLKRAKEETPSYSGAEEDP